MNSDSFRKIEDDFNDITSIVYDRNFHHICGNNTSYIRFYDNKIYILHTVYAGFGPKLVHLFESVVTKEEFIDELKKLKMNKWKFDYPPDPNKGVGLYGEGFYINIKTSTKREYTYCGRGEKPDTYLDFAVLIGVLFNSVRNLKIFGISASNYDDWYFGAIDKYIAKKRITDSSGEAILRIDRNMNSLDGRISNIKDYIQEWKWANSYVVEMADNKPMPINDFNKMAIGWNELSRGDKCRENKNYDLALMYYLNALKLDSSNYARYIIPEMIEKGEVTLDNHPELEMYVTQPKKPTIEDIIGVIRKNIDNNS
jgi:hypothetical protein